MIKRFAVVLTAVLLTAVGAQADSLSFSFNDSSAQLRYSYLLNSDYSGTSLLQFRGLYNDDQNTALGSAGVEFSGSPGDIPGLTIGVGADAYLGTSDPDETLGALGVAGSVGFAPPILRGVSLNARVAYAPNILSVADLDRLLEASFNVGYAITPRVKLFAEYQTIRADFDDRDSTSIDKDFRIGFAGTF